MIFEIRLKVIVNSCQDKRFVWTNLRTSLMVADMVWRVASTALAEVRCEYTEIKCNLTNLLRQVELLRERQRDIGRGNHEATELASAETPTPNIMTKLRISSEHSPSNPRLSTSHCGDAHTHAVSNLYECDANPCVDNNINESLSHHESCLCNKVNFNSIDLTPTTVNYAERNNQRPEDWRVEIIPLCVICRWALHRIWWGMGQDSSVGENMTPAIKSSHEELPSWSFIRTEEVSRFICFYIPSPKAICSFY